MSWWVERRRESASQTVGRRGAGAGAASGAGARLTVSSRSQHRCARTHYAQHKCERMRSRA